MFLIQQFLEFIFAMKYYSIIIKINFGFSRICIEVIRVFFIMVVEISYS